jgi:hypothetical protein
MLASRLPILSPKMNHAPSYYPRFHGCLSSGILYSGSFNHAGM